MKKKYHTLRAVPTSNKKIVEKEVKSIPLTLGAKFHGLIQTFELKMTEYKHSLLLKVDGHARRFHK